MLTLFFTAFLGLGVQIDCTACTVRAREAFLVVTDPYPTATGYELRINSAVQPLSPVVTSNEVEFLVAEGLRDPGVYLVTIAARLQTGARVPTNPGTLTVVRQRIKD